MGNDINWRKTAHRYFDVLWLYKYYHSGKNIRYWRTKQYSWLASKMGIPKSECHMSTMTKEQCMEVIDICGEEYARNEKLLDFAEDYENGNIFQWFKIN